MKPRHRKLKAIDAGNRSASCGREAVNAMLLNEFMNEHRAFEGEHGRVERLEKQVAALAAGLQTIPLETVTLR